MKIETSSHNCLPCDIEVTRTLLISNIVLAVIASTLLFSLPQVTRLPSSMRRRAFLIGIGSVSWLAICTIALALLPKPSQKKVNEATPVEEIAKQPIQKNGRAVSGLKKVQKEVEAEVELTEEEKRELAEFQNRCVELRLTLMAGCALLDRYSADLRKK